MLAKETDPQCEGRLRPSSSRPPEGPERAPGNSMRSRRRIPGCATWNRNYWTIKRDSGEGGARAAGRAKSSPAAQRCLLFYRLLINSLWLMKNWLLNLIWARASITSLLYLPIRNSKQEQFQSQTSMAFAIDSEHREGRAMIVGWSGEHLT